MSDLSNEVVRGVRMLTIPETVVLHQRPATAAVRSQAGPLPPISRDLTVDNLSVNASSLNSNNNNSFVSLSSFRGPLFRHSGLKTGICIAIE